MSYADVKIMKYSNLPEAAAGTRGGREVYLNKSIDGEGWHARIIVAPSACLPPIF